jgi:hypothetical protein
VPLLAFKNNWGNSKFLMKFLTFKMLQGRVWWYILVIPDRKERLRLEACPGTKN